MPTMPRPPRPLLDAARLVSLALGLLVLVGARPAWGRPFDVIGSDWEGCADFVRLARDDLGDARVRAQDHIDLGALRPIDTVVMIHPERSLDVGSFARFMREGGRVLLLDDYGTGEALLEHFSLRRIAAPANPSSTILDNAQLAVAEADGAHPVVAGVQRVVLNHPTGIKHNDLSSLLVIRRTAGEPVNVAVAGMVGKGRFLAVGDPSIVMNRMLRYPGNRGFARGLIGYAADQDTWGKRDGLVYVITGAFEQRGTYGDDGSSIELGERLRGIRDMAQTVRRDGLPAGGLYALAVLVGLGLVLWVGNNGARVHRPVAPRFTRPIPLVAQGGVAGHVEVLAARGTSRALAMLELKSALEERFAGLLELDRIPSHGSLLNELERSELLRAGELHELKELFTRLAHIETLVVSRRAAALGNVADSEVLKTAATIKRLVDAAERRKRDGSSVASMTQPGVP